MKTQTPLQMLADTLADTAHTAQEMAEAQVAQMFADQCAAFPRWPEICASRAEGERIERMNQAQNTLKGL